MSGSPERFSAEALADVAHLARSENRVRILVRLAEAPATRRELEVATGIARATVGRAIGDFEDRGWVHERGGREYGTTPSSDRLVAEFVPFLQAVEAVGRLRDRVAWLPIDEVPIELRHFGDATIRRPDPADPLAPVNALTDLLRAATEFHCLVGVAPPLGFEQAMRDGVVDGDLVTRHVITEDELEYLGADPGRRSRWHEYLVAGANVYCYDGDIPCNLLVFDQTVIVGKYPRDDGPSEFVVSENEAVLAWAHEVISRYQRGADRLEPRML